MSETKVVAPILYVCTAKGCDYSAASVGLDKEGKPRVIQIKTRRGNDKLALQSPPYGVVSAMPGTVARCPVCGAVCTDIEDGRHKFLRLNSQRVSAVREKMRLIGNTMKGAQYTPTIDDLVKVQKILYTEFDVLSDLIDKRTEKINNPDATRTRTHAGMAKVKIPFSL